MCSTKAITALKKQKKRRVSEDLTAWVASEDVSSGFIVQEDEEGVGECTEPPTWPKGWTDREIEFQLECDKRDKSTLRRLEKRLC